jgi:biopolymer transport protein ExbB/TolQ
MIALLQAAGAVPTSPKELILNASTETQVVLGILLVLSLVSWAIMLGVGRELTKALRDSTAFAREV